MRGPLDNPPVESIEVGKPDPIETPTDVADPRASDLSETDRIQLARSLGIEDFTELKKHAEKFNRLIEWAKLNGAKDTIDIIGQVKQLGNRIGDRSLVNLATYAYLEMERMQLDAKMRRLESRG